MVEERKDLQWYMDRKYVVLGTDPSLIPKYIGTGIPSLDIFLDGGLKRNSMSMWFGPYAQGKTWTAQRAAKAAIEAKLTVGYIDVEKAFDPDWWNQVGVNLRELVVARPSHGEMAADIAINMVKDEYDLVIIDSVAAMVPVAEDDAATEQNFVGLHPRLVSRFCRDINMANTNSHVFLINQIRLNVGMIYGNPTTFPGGKALEHYPSTVMVCGRDSWIEEGKVKKGQNFKYSIWKHRGRSKINEFIKVPVMFSGKMDEVNAMIDMFIDKNLVVQKGAHYTVASAETGEVLGSFQGRAKLAEFFNENENIYKAFCDAL